MDAKLPIVLLHGVGLDSTMWDQFRDEVRRASDREVLALDLPGHGSRPPLEREVSLGDLANDVGNRLPARAHLVGFSLGALIAQHLARFQPERVATLTSVSSVCLRTLQEAESVDARLQNAAADFSGSVEASIERWFPADAGTDPATVAGVRRTLLANDPSSYLHAYRVFATADAEIGAELGAIAVPSLAVTGDQDPGSTPEMTRRLGEAIPGARTAVVPNTRHMLPVQRPAELARIIIEFIEESSRDIHD
ncbi:alpha/beta fold hydrolase [Arthrobacter crystallopoietes]|uniref:Pimeloyl-ACP methyl ester carboxylesterase n=1 Tax=Crystallibacter crystallopoietes TaxID=37928 RepID=A0A1H1BRP3_9MICC|nr:alpha/beta hydrolase [Arthrobacter crystallopoietes]AUI51047.1 alpha/beta hydrolase [Arthrobacter crystallopoietes]SDQ54611.1 Pimeloyl-ACP methyl ester carboxylesterase [Arthrobacter crystallopoietes]